MEFSTDESVYDTLNVGFTIRLKNTGTVFQRPQGFIIVENMFGTQVEFGDQKLKLVDEQSVVGILPGSERRYRVTTASESFGLGRYTATLNIVYGDEQQRISNSDFSVTFWVLPFKQIALFIVGVLAVIFGGVLALRAYVRRALRNAGIQAVTQEERKRIETLPARLLRVTLWFFALVVLLLIALLVYYG
jgi:hypothetical protein